MTVDVYMKIVSSTVFKNFRSSLTQHCERSEQLLDFVWTKVYLENAKTGKFKCDILSSFQTM